MPINFYTVPPVRNNINAYTCDWHNKYFNSSQIEKWFEMEESLGKCKTRHKLELKAWEKNKISLTKQAKKDKTKLGEIEKQEQELLERHKQELAKYEETNSSSVKDDGKGEEEEEGKKVEALRMKAQKKKDKRAAKEEERMKKADSTAYDLASKNSAGEVEKRKIAEKVAKHGKKIKEVQK